MDINYKEIPVRVTKKKKSVMGVLSSKTTQILLPRIIINVPVTVQSDSQGQSEASSHWPSNIGWFMKSCLRTPGQLTAVGACERGPCRVSLCGRLPGLACLAENFNFFLKKNSNHLETYKPSIQVQVGAGWIHLFGMLLKETTEGKDPGRLSEALACVPLS